MKIARQYNLPHTDKYYIIDQSYLSIENGGGTLCENCNKLITNIVTIKNEDGKSYKIGTDCAKTLSGLNQTELKKAEVKIGIIKKFYKKLQDLAKNGWDPAVIINETRAHIATFNSIGFDGKPMKETLVRFHGSIDIDKIHITSIQKYIKKSEELRAFDPPIPEYFLNLYKI